MPNDRSETRMQCVYGGTRSKKRRSLSHPRASTAQAEAEERRRGSRNSSTQNNTHGVLPPVAPSYSFTLASPTERALVSLTTCGHRGALSTRYGSVTLHGLHCSPYECRARDRYSTFYVGLASPIAVLPFLLHPSPLVHVQPLSAPGAAASFETRSDC